MISLITYHFFTIKTNLNHEAVQRKKRVASASKLVLFERFGLLQKVMDQYLQLESWLQIHGYMIVDLR